MRAVRRLAAALALICLGESGATAGSYFLISTKIREANPNLPGNVGPFAIVHPPGWSGQSGTFTVRLCVRPGSEAFIPSLDWAIETWNCRLPNHPNCPDCRTAEDVTPPPFPGGPFPSVGTTYSLAGVILHEVGHCAVGLDHPNLTEWITTIASQPWRTGTCDADSNGSCGDQTSFTEVGMATEVLVGADGIRGSRDDTPLNQCGFIAPPLAPWMVAPIPDPDAAANAACRAKAAQDPLSITAECSNGTNVQCCPPCPGPACPTAPMAMQHLAWFRQADNNPFTRDGVVIDRNTFTRNPNLLPAGSSYAANGNRRVGVALGYSGSQEVMYSGIVRGQGYNGLTAGDVNMLRMAMTGVDRFANSPAPPDDYVLVLERVADCTQAHIEVYDNPVVGSTSLGGCIADIEPSPTVPPVGGLVLHYSIKTTPKPAIAINTWLPFDLLLPLPYIDFESGDLTKWTGGSTP